MSHSLRAKIKGLRYKGIITDKDCDRLCKALDNEDVLNKIKTEIKALPREGCWVRFKNIERIIDKYRTESEG